MSVGMSLVIDLSDRGATAKVTSLNTAFTGLKNNVRGGAASITAGAAKISKGVSGATAVIRRFAMVGKMAMAALAVATIVVGAKFEQSMANVASVAGATDAQLKELANTARYWGSKTAFSASEAAKGMYSLASAGQSVAEMKKSVGPVLLFAGAAATSLGQAAEMTVQSLKMFKLQASDASRVTNLFAAGISKSMLNADRLKEALAQVGASANAMGLSIEETVGYLGNLHNAGMLGGVAGTRLKGVLTRLASPNAVLKRLLGDVSLKTHSLAGVMQHLAESGAEAGEVFKSFGRIAAPAVLSMMVAGQKEMDAMRQAITGTDKAMEMYEQQMNTVASQFKIFKSALQENMIAAFMALKPVLRSSMQTMISGMQNIKPLIIGAIKYVINYVKANKDMIITVLNAGKKLIVFGVAFAVISKAVTTSIALYNILHGTLLVGIGIYKGLALAASVMKVAMVNAWFYTQLGAAHAMASMLVQTAIFRAKIIAHWIAIHVAALGPWGWLVIGIAAALAGAVMLVIKFKDQILGTMKMLGKAWLWYAKKYAEVAMWVGNKIKEFFRKPIEWVVDKLRWLAEKMSLVMEMAFPGWKKSLDNLLNYTKEKTDAAGGAIKNAAAITGHAVSFAFDKAKSATASAAGFMGNKIQELKNKISGMMDDIKGMGAGSMEMDVSVSGGKTDPTSLSGIWDNEMSRRRAVKMEDLQRDISAMAVLADKEKATLMSTVEFKSASEQEWLDAKLQLIENNYLAETEAANLTESQVMALKIQKSRDTADAKKEHNAEVLAAWWDNHQSMWIGIDMLSAAYDTFFSSLIDKEMTGKERREAIWDSMKKSFLRSSAMMFKQWLIMKIKSIMIGAAFEEAANKKSKFAAAKTGAVRAYSAFASVPLIGPALGAIAAAMAFAFLMAFHTGGMIPGSRDDMIVNVQGGEYMTRRSSVNTETIPALDYINATGRAPDSGGGSVINLQFSVGAGAYSEEEVEEIVEDQIVPILHNLQKRNIFQPA